MIRTYQHKFMINIAYTITAEIRMTLSTTESVRKDILLIPLSPRRKRQLRWDTWIRRLYHLQGEKTFSKEQISHILRSGTHQKDPKAQILLNYKLSIERLYEQWFANTKHLSMTDIQSSLEALTQNTQPQEAVSADMTTIKHLLSYLQTHVDGPITTAAIAYSQIALMTGSSQPQPVALLLAYLFLFKYGFDTRGLLTLERGMRQNPREYAAAMTEITEKGSSNAWIGFFARTITRELERIREKIHKPATYQEEESLHIELNERQREIMILIETTKKLTNRQVQKQFHVSQITASRDLAKLVSIGLLLSHGKGRSVYYTKI